MFTQKSNDSENYKEHDPTGSFEYRKNKLESNFYFYLGFFIILCGYFFYTLLDTESVVEYERDKVFEQRRREADEQREWLAAKQNNAVLNQSQDLLKDKPMRSI